MSSNNGCDTVDVVVVGAGMAGLYCALTLKQRGLRVLVLEARDRVGGRTFTEPWKVPGVAQPVAVDIGGQWIGPPQKLVSDLVKKYSLQTENQYHAGTNIIDVQGKIIHSSGMISELKNFAPGELERIWKLLDAMALNVDVSRPWESPNSRELDSISFKQWVSRNCADKVTAWLVEWFAAVCIAADTEDISFLYFLVWLKSGGGYQPIVDIENGAQNFRLVGGMQQLAERLRADIGQDKVVLSSPVTCIEQVSERACRVAYGNREQMLVTCRHVVVAMSPSVASAKIKFVPALPPSRHSLAQRMLMGRVVKVMVAFRRAFWRDAGFSGEIISDRGPLSIIYDRSSENAGLWCLVGFCSGSKAAAWSSLPETERKTQVLEQLGRTYQKPQEVNDLFAAYIDHDWSAEEFSGGCFFSYFPPGVLTSSAAPSLRESHGNVHWSGTETSDFWIGYIDGALNSGLRAAEDVAKRIFSPSKL